MDSKHNGSPGPEPEFWIVVRRRGGWNVAPEIVGLFDHEGTAMLAALTPEMGRYDPPADGTDLFTWHAVMPMTMPYGPYPLP